MVLAKSIATLDILSGGRAELGLGAGAFWDAIVAAGGERRTPKESVDALVEAIGVIRGTWGQDPERPGARSVTSDGSHYPVAGLRAGPAPLHRVEIWLGAYKPRMLAVTGRLADGWLPSMGYADPSALAAMSRPSTRPPRPPGGHPRRSVGSTTSPAASARAVACSRAPPTTGPSSWPR